MSRISKQTIHTLTLALAAALSSGNALAEKPSWAGDKAARPSQGQEEPQSRGQRHEAAGMSVSVSFNNEQRTVVQNYFDRQSRAGRCPPGLAKKKNGCLPPGQAKKWSIGKPLPGDAVIYDLPSSVTVKLGTPPAGHRYVRVAADILLIAVGTSMVVDAIEDIGRQ